LTNLTINITTAGINVQVKLLLSQIGELNSLGLVDLFKVVFVLTDLYGW